LAHGAGIPAGSGRRLDKEQRVEPLGRERHSAVRAGPVCRAENRTGRRVAPSPARHPQHRRHISEGLALRDDFQPGGGRSGKSLSGSELGATDSEITIKRLGHSVGIPKDDVIQAYYVRFKPVSEAHKYYAQEAYGLQFLDPKAWQYLLRIDALMSVLLYDSTLPEDNSPLSCPANASKR
jgi:hypothetical protein